MSKNNGGPAFPKPSLKQSGEQHSDNDFNYMEKGQDGMSLRDYFAAKAMQNLCTAIDWIEHPTYGGNITHFWPPEKVTKYAYILADAMLKAREK